MISPTRRFVTALLCGLPLWAASNSVPGIDNFYKVDDNVYRGAQPTEAGFRYLRSIGVNLVIDLREHDPRSVDEERSVTAAGMRYLNVPMTGMVPPTDAQTGQILALLEDAKSGPAFVHCKRGADRTGAVIAAYRIDHDKWENARALTEAESDHMSRLQFRRKAFIRAFQPRTAVAAAGAIQ